MKRIKQGTETTAKQRLFVICLFCIGIILFAADRLIKIWAASELLPVRTMDFIKIGKTDIIGLFYTENTGAAFSIFSGAKYFLIVVNILLMAGLVVYIVRSKTADKITLLSITLIISGGLGNIYDRITLGYVIDYIEVRLFSFAIFNFADMCVVVGAFLLGGYMLFMESKNSNKK